MFSFILCGACAGLAGAVQVTQCISSLGALIPSISSGYGFLGLLVAMLINYQAIWAAPIALFYAALNIGGINLPILLKLDSSLSGVLQGVLVLFVMLVEGARQRLFRKTVGSENAKFKSLGWLAWNSFCAGPIMLAVIGETISERAGILTFDRTALFYLQQWWCCSVARNHRECLILGFIIPARSGYRLTNHRKHDWTSAKKNSS